ncbi:hypothetical protein FOA43_000817 [Brettanomyces nanus]|uniref:CCAAT-binding factor domain-containing protein n=1 Tax=Eeniella nana TaxID=13502 RepID=A0A875RX03_EENNA|nr:uncharacterized protein FOA43_000817 [Brettanomyces nanus]QPG73506.1 hypothetical protein FOA43_000817 [Brettanomyces nanus]
MSAKRKSIEEDKSLKRPKNVITVDDIKRWHKEISTSPKYYNNIVRLLDGFTKEIEKLDTHSKKDDDDDVIKTFIVALTQIFQSLLTADQLRISRHDNEQQVKVSKWLRTKYQNYLESIYQIWALEGVSDGVVELQIDGLSSLMTLLQVESDTMAPSKEQPYFATGSYKSILKALLLTGNQTQIREQGYTIDNPLILEFYDQYFSNYWDIKYFFFDALSDIVKELESKEMLFFANVITLVKLAPMYPEKDIEKYISERFVANPPSKVESIFKFRSNFEKSWTQMMTSLSLSPAEYKSILLIIHKRIIPFFEDPSRLMDFLTDAYDLGFEEKDISLSILALNGLWELMKNYNLEYPDFYTKLYGILTPELLHLNYRNRFFRLLDLFMSSTHLSAAIVASFIKQLSRLSLTAPATAIVAVIPFVYNLLKRHPTCMLLIHNTSDVGKDFVDPFKEEETDPSNTDALESSLWELQTMMNHYHPQVASLAKILSQPFNKYNYNMEDFLDWSYQRLFDSEMTKRFKGELGVEFEQWDTMFGDDGFMKGYTF